MADPPIERAEVVALLFNVSDIAVTLTTIERLAVVLANARRTRELAERAQAELDSEDPRG